MLSQGVVLSDRYLLNERVATGGMGDVWWATDVLLRRKVAVKVLLPSLVSDSEFITRFRTEARMMASLRHPGIVQVYDYGEDAVVDGNRVDYLVMEYIEGAPLSKWLQSAGKLGVAETMSIVTQAAQALHVAHNAGIVHRDVKPSNLLIQPDGSVVLVDFGVARSTNLTSITATNIVLGSAHYMAPEQASGQGVSAASDIYALGAVAYCCLTGRPPFTGDNPIQVVTQHLDQEPPALPAEIPAPVAALVTRALAKAPANRFPSAAALADAARSMQNVALVPPPLQSLQTLANPAPAPAPSTVPGLGAAQPSVARPGGAGRWRRTAVLISVAATVVTVLAGVVIVVSLNVGGEKEPDKSVAQLPAGISVPGAGSLGEKADATDAATGKPSRTASAPAESTHSATAPATGGPSAGGKPHPSTTKPTPSKAPQQHNPYTAAEICGGGYQVIDSAKLTGSDGGLRGTVYLLYNASNGYNCVTAVKATSVGTKSTASTYLEVQGHTRTTDSGSFSYYAGPVRASAAGACVKWGGAAGGASYNSAFEHCD